MIGVLDDSSSADFLWSAAISNCLTLVYANEPNKTIALEVHQRVDFTSLNQYVAITVCAQALAVPDILCVSGDVTWNKQKKKHVISFKLILKTFYLIYS